jgi:hypothetical protein
MTAWPSTWQKIFLAAETSPQVRLSARQIGLLVAMPTTLRSSSQ